MLKHILWGVLFSFITLISCYQGHGLDPPGDTAGIQGRITFLGTWPDSTKEIRIIVMKNYPKGMTDTDSLMQYVLTAILKGELISGEPLPLFVDHVDYELPLDPGEYNWVLVAWFPDIPDYFLGVKEIGAYYQNPKEQDLPTPISVIQDVMTDGIDIIANLEYIHNEIPFF